MYPGSSQSLESLRHMRLMALLRNMIDDWGQGADGGGAGRQLPNRGASGESGQARLTDRIVGRIGAAPAAGGRLGCRPTAGSGRCVGGAGVCFGAGAARRPRSRRGRGQGAQGGARKVDAARGAAAGAVGGGKERVRDALSDRSGGLSQGRNAGTFAPGRIPSWWPWRPNPTKTWCTAMRRR